jgi:hypothetical protein
MTDKAASDSVIARATAKFQSGESTTTRSNTNDTNRASTSSIPARTESGGGYTKSTSPTLTPSQRAQIQFQEQNEAREAQNQTKDLSDYGTAGILWGMEQKNAQYKTNPQAYASNKQESDIQKLATRRGLSIAEVNADLANIEPATIYSNPSGVGYSYPKSVKTQYERDLSQIAGKKEFTNINNRQGMLEKVGPTTHTYYVEQKPVYKLNDVGEATPYNLDNSRYIQMGIDTAEGNKTPDTVAYSTVLKAEAQTFAAASTPRMQFNVEDLGKSTIIGSYTLGSIGALGGGIGAIPGAAIGAVAGAGAYGASYLYENIMPDKSPLQYEIPDPMPGNPITGSIKFVGELPKKLTGREEKLFTSPEIDLRWTGLSGTQVGTQIIPEKIGLLGEGEVRPSTIVGLAAFGKIASIAYPKVPNTAKIESRLGINEKPFTGLAKGEKLAPFKNEFTGNIRGGDSRMANIMADSNSRTASLMTGGKSSWLDLPLKSASDYIPQSRYYYVGDKAYTLRIPKTVERTGISRLDKKMMFDDVKPETRIRTKDIDFGPQLEPKTWGYRTEKPVIDFTEYKGDITYTKMTRGGEKAAAREVTAFDYNNIREIKQPKTSSKTTGSGDLMLLQKEEQITRTINKQPSIVEKTGLSRLDKKMMFDDVKQSKGADSYYNPTKNAKTYDYRQYDSSTMMDMSYETIRTPTQRPTTPSILLGAGMFSTLRQNQVQTQKIDQQQLTKLGIGLKQTQQQGQGQKQAQKQLQQQLQQQKQQQKQIQKQTQELFTDTYTIEKTVKQKQIDKPLPKPTPDYVPDVIKPYKPEPIVPLWLPGGGSHGGGHRKGSQYPNYLSFMKYHPIFTAKQVSRIILGGKRR